MQLDRQVSHAHGSRMCDRQAQNFSTKVSRREPLNTRQTKQKILTFPIDITSELAFVAASSELTFLSDWEQQVINSQRLILLLPTILLWCNEFLKSRGEKES